VLRRGPEPAVLQVVSFGPSADLSCMSVTPAHCFLGDRAGRKV